MLDWVHRHKKLVSALIVGVAAAVRALDYHQLSDLILTLGTLLGTGFLPNGPNNPFEVKKDSSGVSFKLTK